MEQREIIPGFDLVFRKDHRVYSIRGKDGRRIPLSTFGFRDGLSLRTAGYFGAVVAAMFVLRHVLLVSMLFGWVPWIVAYVAIPGVVAFALSKVEPDGQPVTHWLAAMVAHVVSPRDRCAGRRIRGEGVTAVVSPVTAVAVDERVLGPCRVRGPATVEFLTPVQVRQRRRRRYVARASANGAALPIELVDGETLTVLA
jgi:conjugation transfer TcpE-like protein